MRKWAVVMLATMGAMFLLAAAQAQPQTVLLEMKGEAGEKLQYSNTFGFAMDMHVWDPDSGQQIFSISPRITGDSVTINRITNVADNGDLTMSTQVQSFSVTLDVADLHAALSVQGPGGGPPQLIKLPPLPLQLVVSKRGKLVAIEGLESLPIPPIPQPGGGTLDIRGLISKALAQYSQPIFPAEPVRVGQSWTWEMVIEPAQMMESLGVTLPPEAKAGLGQVKIPIKSTSTLTGFEMVDGVECARIEQLAPWELTIPVGQGPAGQAMEVHEEGRTAVTTLFDYDAGRTVKQTTNVSFSMRVGTAQIAVVDMSMEVDADTELR